MLAFSGSESRLCRAGSTRGRHCRERRALHSASGQRQGSPARQTPPLAGDPPPAASCSALPSILDHQPRLQQKAGWNKINRHSGSVSWWPGSLLKPDFKLLFCYEWHFVLSGFFFKVHLAVIFQMAVVLTIDKN